MLQDHPRACGENTKIEAALTGAMGSPPRMRGKPNVYTDVVAREGITPAHAGKTAPTERARRDAWDHPRACGENSATLPTPPRNRGSPPRMREKPGAEETLQARHGITPAHAGKTCESQQQDAHYKDHPRACGENCAGISRPSNKTGSPPRMRGKLPYWSTAAGVKRITPAHAGKTCGQKRQQPRFRDHPRACGENCRCLSRALSKAGSPPRMRGKRGYV